MHHTLLVHEGHGRQQLLEDGTCLLLSEAVSLPEAVQQLATLYQLHHHVDVELVREYVHQSHDVGVALAQLQDLDLTTRVVSTCTMTAKGLVDQQLHHSYSNSVPSPLLWHYTL